LTGGRRRNGRKSTSAFVLGLVAAALVIASAAGGLLISQTTTGKSILAWASEPWRTFQTKKRDTTKVRRASRPKKRDIANTQTFKFNALKTAFETLEFVEFPIRSAGRGGAVAVIDDYILFVTPHGKLGYLRQEEAGADYELQYVDAKVPMGLSELTGSAITKDPRFELDFMRKKKFRTMDLLPLRNADGTFDLYVSHHRYAEDCIEFVVSRVTIDVSKEKVLFDGSSWETVFVAKPCIPLRAGDRFFFSGHQSGGRLAQTSRDTLLVTVGDHKFDGVHDPIRASMDPDSDLGKAVEINLNTKSATIFASGLRNPQGLTVSSDGLIWETEHGPVGGDEVNILRRGENYGWPEVSSGIWKLNRVQGRHDGYTKPVFVFVSAIGISNLIETSSDEFPLWKGDLLIASLKGRAIWRLRRDGDRIISAEPIDVGRRLRDLKERPNGQLVVLTDRGTLLLIRRKRASGDDREQDAAITVSGNAALSKIFNGEETISKPSQRKAGRGEQIFKDHCAGCHAVSNETIAGPPLAGVVGRKIGSVEDYPYSQALTRAGGVWTKKRLIDFLSNPQKNFEGAEMEQIDLSPEQYQLVVQYLSESHE